MSSNKLLLILLFAATALSGQETPFSRGVNLTGWFQTGSARQIQFSKYTRQDFVQIQRLGCDVIRLPINLHAMTGGEPDHTLDPLFLSFLDQAVDWAEDLGLHLILDNHTFDPATNTDPTIGGVLQKVWLQMAAHFKDRSELVYYEILNEPHGISDALWNSIQQDVVAAIRTVDDRHTIIVGPASWNSYHNLAAMPVYQDQNLIYTFHFYDPFLFTHQGATWTDPSMDPLADMPFPYRAGDMPSFPPQLNGTWLQSAFNNYASEGTVARLKNLIDVAVAFRNARKVPVYCGEFGVYIPNSDNADRVYWYDQVRSYLEEKNIAWTIWDYHGGFGLFREDSNGLFDHDLNTELLSALGLDTPPQTPYVTQPDTTGFLIYSDFIGPHIFESSYNDGIIDFYHGDQVHNDAFSLRWSDARQYNNIGFDFRPDKDLSYLRAHGYGLDFYVRGTDPATVFDIRFLDTKTAAPNDHPWRIRVTVDRNTVAWDGQWHHVHLPLSAFTEHGAWDNNTWYNPVGAFDWAATDRLEIVAEHRPMQGQTVWFDHIRIAKPGTTASAPAHAPGLDISVFPNPTRDVALVQTAQAGILWYEVWDVLGRPLLSGRLQSRGRISLDALPAGAYWLRVRDERGSSTVKKIWKQ